MSILFKEKTNKYQSNENLKVINDIKIVTSNISALYNQLDNVTDNALIEAIILELSALESRYRHLLEIAKEKHIVVNAKRSILVPDIVDYENAIA